MSISNHNLCSDDLRCKNCKNPDSMRFCYKEGNLVCISCGFVSHSRFIDPTAEWRNFSDGNSSGVDPRRAGGIVNEALSDGGIGVFIRGKDSFKVNEFEKRMSSPQDKAIFTANQKLTDWSHSLNLQKGIYNRAMDFYEKIKKSKKLNGKNMNAVLAALLCICSRLEKNALQFSLVEAKTGVSQNDIKKCYMIVKSLLKVPSTHPKIFVGNIASKLKLESHLTNAATDIATKISDLGIVDGKNPRTIAAVSLYISLSLSNDAQKKSIKDISYYAEIADNTIKNAYKDIYPKRFEIIKKEEWMAPLDTLPFVN